MSFFQKNLKILRTAWRHSQRELSERFGVSQAAYSAWEKFSEPSYRKLVSISEFYNISIDDLLKKELSDDNLAGHLEKLVAESESQVEAESDLYKIIGKQQVELLKEREQKIEILQVLTSVIAWLETKLDEEEIREVKEAHEEFMTAIDRELLE